MNSKNTTTFNEQLEHKLKRIREFNAIHNAEQVKRPWIEVTTVEEIINHYRNLRLKEYAKEAEEQYGRIEVSENGSILPNRHAGWPRQSLDKGE